jgi:hypothetical protein
VRKSTQWDWQEPLAVPNSLRRYLLVGVKKDVADTVGGPTN